MLVDAHSSRIIDGPSNVTVSEIHGLITSAEPTSTTISSSLSIGDCSAGGSFDTQAEENLKKSIAASIGLDDWTLINIKSASCDGSTASGRRLAGGGNFMIKFDITVPAPASTAAGTPAVASLTPDSRLDASALQSTSFLSKLATNYNTAQAETGGSALDVSTMSVEVEPAPAPSGGAARAFTLESGNDKDTTIPLKLARLPNADVTVSVVSSDTTEAVVYPSQLVFTPTTNGTLVVNVVGVDDDSVDGDQDYSVRIHFDSDDKRFQYDSEYKFVNKDDDVYGMLLEFVDPTENTTSEMGQVTKARLTLTAQPTGSVVVTSTVTKSSEATVEPAIAVLGPDTWKTGVEFTLTGRADGVPDGDTTYELHSSIAMSADSGFSALGISKLTVGSRDEPLNEVSFRLLNESFECITSENDTEFQVIYIRLNSWPLMPKDELFFSVHLTPGPKYNEGSVWLLDGSDGQLANAPQQQLLTIFNWQKPIAVAIRGTTDDEVDGSEAYGVYFAGTVAYFELAPQVRSIPSQLLPASIQCKSKDVDTASIIWADEARASEFTDSTRKTSELGTVYYLKPRLSSRPLKEVIFLCLSSDVTEGRVLYRHIVDRIQWKTGITIAVEGQDDELVDGDMRYNISCTTSSEDVMYDGKSFRFVFMNADDDVQGLAVWQAGESLTGYGLPVDETGALQNLTVSLIGIPEGTVYVRVTSSDPSELLVKAAGSFGHEQTLTFTPANWNIRQYMEYRGVDDLEMDGDQEVTITFVITVSEPLPNLCALVA